MYKSVCSYQSVNDGVLSFPSGKVFNLIEQLDEHWWSMQDEFGNTGLIPATYLEVNNVNKDEVLRSLRISIECIKNIALSRKRKLNENERRNIMKLNEAYETIQSGGSLWNVTDIPQQPKRQAPKAPASPSPSKAGGVSTKRAKSTKRYSAPLPPETQEQGKRRSSSSSSTSSINSPTTPTSSKVYNIQVSQGDASLPDAKDIIMPSLQSLTITEDGDNGTVTKVTSIQGKNLTITRTETVEKQEEQQDSASVSNMSVVSDSTGSFVSSTATMVTGSDQAAPSILPLAVHSNFEVSEGFGKELVDNVRSRCKISFNKSLAAVRCVLQSLGNELPGMIEVTKSIERQIQDERLNVYKGSLAAEDAQRLYTALDQLSEHKEDSQQRNWAIHEDYSDIKTLLDEVVKTIDEIDPSISKSILKEDEFKYMNDLILLYQMEHRTKLRVALLHVFGCCCQLGEEFVSALLCSVLPTELAQDMTQDKSDMTKFLTTGLMLTMIFSTGESVPYHHYVQFNDDFVNFVLDTIEDPPDNDVDDQVSDTLIGMLLSFNQHFKAPRSSTLIQVLKNRTVFRTLTEKILLLLNRETDPCAMFDFVDPCPDSVLKFLIDVFSAKETSQMFYTSDLYVLFDIILRQLVNREEKDKVRTEYLSLFHSILNTTDYADHKRHASEFRRRLSEILSNEENESEVDVYIVREILKRFASMLN